MDLIAVLRSIEEFIFDVLLWPRDIVHYLLCALLPWKVHKSIKDEWTKASEDRFRHRLSPTMFWILAVAVPFYWVLNPLLNRIAEQNPALLSITEQPWAIKLAVLTIILMAYPLSSASVIHKRSDDKGRDRDTLKRLFATQCIVLAPASLLLLASITASDIFLERAKPANNALFISFLIASIYAQTSITLCELSAGWFDKLDTVTTCVGRSFVHAMCVGVLGLTLVLAANGRLNDIPTTTATGTVEGK